MAPHDFSTKKETAQQPVTAFLSNRIYWKFQSGTAVVIGCLAIFFLVLKLWSVSHKKTPCIMYILYTIYYKVSLFATAAVFVFDIHIEKLDDIGYSK